MRLVNNSTGWKRFPVRINNRTYPLPYFESGRGPVSVVVTAGLDGDEYAPMRACFKLREILDKKYPDLKITLLPLVNLPGFAAVTSVNPGDGKYPKSFFPGKTNGTDSEKLMFQVSRRFLSGAAIWIDLHGGAVNEELVPCVLSYRSGVQAVDRRTIMALAAVGARETVFQADCGWSKIRSLSAGGTAYIILESGCRGRQKTDDVERLVSWTRRIIQAIIAGGGTVPSKKSVYSRLNEYYLPEFSWWEPLVSAGDTVIAGQALGTCRPVSRTGRKRYVFSTVSGKVLWLAATPAVLPKSAAAAVASEKVALRG